MIYTLIKIFEKKKYAEDFLKGSLYLNTLKYFAEEHVDGAGEKRGDTYEGLLAHYQPSKIGTITVGDIIVPGDQLASPVLVHGDGLLSSNVFCMYAVNRKANDVFNNREEFLQSLKIYESCFGLGSYCAVILNTPEFISRFRKGLHSRGIPFQHGLVEYFDETSYHGNLPAHELGFHKRRSFAHQSEYRFLLEPFHGIPGPLLIDLGNLEDIVILMTPKEFNEGVGFEFSEDIETSS